MDRTPEYSAYVDPVKNPKGIFPLLIQMRGIRAGSMYNNVVILAGPNLNPTKGIAFFGWNATTGDFLGGIRLLGYNNIRQFLKLNGNLYTGVGTNDSAGKITGGAILRVNPSIIPGCTFNPSNPVPCWLLNGGSASVPTPPTVVGNLGTVSGTLTAHNGRIFTATWPSTDLPGALATLYMSPAVPAEGLTSANAAQWTALWKASDYEPDTAIAQSYAGGAIASFDGYLWWGTLHIPMSSFQYLARAYPPKSQEAALKDMSGTFRSTVFFRIKDPDTNPQIDIVYGNYELPVFTPPADATSSGTWSLKVNNMGKKSLWGTSGFGNAWNTYSWSATVWNNRLWVGTMDWSFLSKQGAALIVAEGGTSLPADMYANTAAGSDLFYFTSASKPAFAESTNGVDNPMNYGVRNQISSMNGNLFLGTANAMNLLTDPADPHHFGGLGGWELNELTPKALNTPAGANVTVTLSGGVSITYCSVSTAGTTITATVPNPYDSTAEVDPIFAPYDLSGPELPPGIARQPTDVVLLWSSSSWGTGCDSAAKVVLPIPAGITTPRLLELQWDGMELLWKDITTGIEPNQMIAGAITNGYLGIVAVAPAGPAADVPKAIVSPTSGRQGQALSVTLTGQFTNFVQGTTTVNFGAGINVSRVIVASATSATADITIATGAALGARTVTIATGAEILTASNTLTVLAGLPAIANVAPTSGDQGQTLSVQLSGQFTNFVPGTTTVSFGAGIIVNSVSVVKSTTAVANITITTAAAPGARDVMVTTGAELVKAANGFTVTLPAPDAGPPPPPPPPPLAVSITAPASGVTVSGPTVTLSASVSGAALGVQFQVDGVNVGAEDTTDPYSITWDATTVANGNHNIIAVARDGVQSPAISTAITVIVKNPVPTTTYRFPTDGGVMFAAENESASSVAVSHARVEQVSGGAMSSLAPPTEKLTGVAIMGLRTNNGLVTEAGLPPVTEMLSGRTYVEIDGRVNTGIALSNTSTTDAQISFYFTDRNGADFPSASFVLKSNHQIAAFLNEVPFNAPPNLHGTFTFRSSVPVAALALRTLTNERGELLISSLPVAGLTGEHGMVLPHFADGGGWSSQIILVNKSDSVRSGTIQFFGQGAQNSLAPLLELNVNGESKNSFSYSLPPHAMATFITAGTNPTATVGSVRITPAFGSFASDLVPAAFAILSFRNEEVTVSEASVPALPGGASFRMYSEASGRFGDIGSIQSGIAIANPWPEPVAVHLEAVNLDGTPASLPAITVTIPAGGQLSKFFGELFSEVPKEFQGILKVKAAASVTIAGLRGRYNERGDFLVTTTPPSNDAEGTPTLVFPHIVSGQGYSTQFVLFGRTGGRVFLFSQNGTLQPGSSLSQQ